MGCNNSKHDDTLSKPENIDKLMDAYNKAKKSVRGNVWIDIFVNNQYPLYELERHKDLISWSACTRYQALPCWFITKYKNRIDFNELSYNKHITDDIIEMFIDDLNFNTLIKCKSLSRHSTDKFISSPDMDEYKKIQLLKAYKFNEPLLEPLLCYKNSYKYKDVVSQYQELSESFISKHERSLNWNLINRYQSISLDFIEKHPKLIRWDELSYNKNLTNDIIYKYRNKLKSTEEVEHACVKKIKHD